MKQDIELLSKETQLGRARITAELVKDIAEVKGETWKWIIAGILLAQVGLGHLDEAFISEKGE